MKSRLNKQQLNKLALTLYLTTKDPISMVKSLFNVDVGDEIYDDLADVEECRQCEECDEWKDGDEMSKDDSSLCESCYIFLNGEDEEYP